MVNPLRRPYSWAGVALGTGKDFHGTKDYSAMASLSPFYVKDPAMRCPDTSSGLRVGPDSPISNEP